MISPLLSIITVNLNNRKGLEKTARSIAMQTSGDFEWIVIDGGSSDGSIDVIKEYSEKISYWISEKDTGIYNAMNKGIKKATGEYLLFLNSSDYLYDKDIIKHVFNKQYEEEILYGNAVIYNINDDSQELQFTEFPRELTLYSFYTWTICHNATFIKRSLHLENLYDESLKISSDYKFFLKCFLNGVSFKHINRTITFVDCTGVSGRPGNPGIFECSRLIDELIPEHIVRKFKAIDSLYKNESIAGKLKSRLIKYSLFAMKYLKERVMYNNYKPSISFSCSGEDLILSYIFHEKFKRYKISYLDVGAGHPYKNNMTFIFYKEKCHGINIEPDPELYNMLRIHRDRDLNLNLGIADQNDESEFYCMSVAGKSTFVEDEAILMEKTSLAVNKKTVMVKTVTLDKIIDQYFAGVFPDLLVINVPGLSDSIFNRLDLSVNYPGVICLIIDAMAENGKIEEGSLEFFVKKSGYCLYAATGNYKIFIKEK